MAKKTSKKAEQGSAETPEVKPSVATPSASDAKLADSAKAAKGASVAKASTPAKADTAAKSQAKAKPASAPTPPQHTAIDPHQHAQSAVASLLARRQQGGTTTGTGGGSSAVQKLKESMNKPQLPASSQFAQANKQTKSHTPAGFGQQRGHHQNNGPNIARTGVPRRTSGG